MKKALFVVFNEAHFKELIRVIEFLSTIDTFQLLVVFEYKYENCEEHILRCLELNALCFDGKCDPLDITLSNIAPAPTATPIPDEDANFLIRNMLLRINQVTFSIYQMYRGWQLRNKTFLMRFKPDIVIQAEVTLNYPMGMMWIDEGHKLDIASLIVPFGLMGLPYNREMAMFYSEDPTRHVNNDSRVERFVSLWASKMVAEHKGIRVFRMPLAETIASKLTNIVPKLPWNPNSCNADAIAVESEGMYDLYKTGGFPEKQLQVVGAMYYDDIATIIDDYNNLRTQLYQDYDIPSSHKLAICGFPPDQFGSRTYGEDTIKNFSDIIAVYAEIFSKIEGWTFLVNPHPRVQNRDFSVLEAIDNVRLTYTDIVQLIPLGDIYVSSSSSSTIRVSVACEKPTIDYDIYGYDHQQFESVSGVTKFRGKKEFSDFLQAITQDETIYTEQLALIRQDATKWGVLDGNVGERLLKLINTLISKTR